MLDNCVFWKRLYARMGVCIVAAGLRGVGLPSGFCCNRLETDGASATETCREESRAVDQSVAADGLSPALVLWRSGQGGETLAWWRGAGSFSGSVPKDSRPRQQAGRSFHPVERVWMGFWKSGGTTFSRRAYRKEVEAAPFSTGRQREALARL